MWVVQDAPQVVLNSNNKKRGGNMNRFNKLACAGLLVAPALSFAADIHPDVQKALDYNLPELTCTKPELPGASKDVVDSNGNVTRADVDSYTLGRYERAEKRWNKCLAKYKKGLMKDFERLKNSAAHGLTQAQANTIMGKMKTIQSAVISPSGKPEESPSS
jgi:hypothetical protein